MKTKSILDPSFRYTRSGDTDLRKTFARIRREQRKETSAQADKLTTLNVSPIVRRATAHNGNGR